MHGHSATAFTCALLLTLLVPAAATVPPTGTAPSTAQVGLDAATPTSLPNLTGAERTAREAYAQAVRRDLRTLKRQCRFLEDVLAVAASHRGLFERAKQPRTVLALQERRLLGGLWQQFYLGHSELAELARVYQLQIEGAGGHRDIDNYDGRLISMTARVAKLIYGERWLGFTDDAETLQLLFDETPAGRGLEGGTYTLFRRGLVDIPDRLDLLHYSKYEVRRPLDPTREFSAAREDTWVEEFWTEHSRELYAFLYLSGAVEDGDGDTSAPRRERSGRDLMREVVRPVAVFMGATKVKHWDSQLITTQQIRDMLPRLEPGDIFLEKTTYYLSNFFITGFWGHTGLYIGSFDEAMRYLNTPEVLAHARRLGHDSLAALIEARFPKALADWQRTDARGAPMRVLEGDGVKANSVFFNTAEDAFSADFIAVLRPHSLSRLDKALALLDALAYWKAEYDFDFDVRSDATLVCTELLAKAYAPGPGKQGIRFPVGDATAGRYVVYPNGIAKMFTAERGQAGQQLSFVYFLRGLEGTRRAVSASEDIFAESSTWESML